MAKLGTFKQSCLLLALTILTLSIDARSKTNFSYVVKPQEKTEQQETAASAQAEWTIFIYMQARNNLAPYAGKNIESIANFKTNPNINFLVQLDQPKQKGAWRYKIEHQQIVLENYSDVENPSDQAEKIVDFVRWGAKNFPAQKYCLVCWNHGVGPLNPPYGNPLRMMLSNQYSSVCLEPNQVVFIEAQEVSRDYNECYCNFGSNSRGVMFDEDNQTYLTNYDLSRMLEKIVSPEILNKKLDCLGFDACYMACQEIATQISQYTNYMIASQELELAHGWNYEKITQSVCAASLNPAQLARCIVTSFGELYRGKTNIFTQSAINLCAADQITVQLNNVIDAIELAAKEDKNFIIDTIKTARKCCQQFTARVYVDLHSFYQQMHELVTAKLASLTTPISHPRQRRGATVDNAKLETALNFLNTTLQTGISGIDDYIVESSCSNYLSQAKGISIYFPMRGIDPSYQACNFAKSSRWLSFISAFSMR